MSVRIVCEGRPCRVQIDPDSRPRLLNSPALGAPGEDAEVIGVGEIFQIEDQDGTYRIERLSGDAEALVINRLS
jgi:hypothetical protein